LKHLAFIYASIGLGIVALWFFAIYAPYRQQIDGYESRQVTADLQLTDFSQTLAALPKSVELRKSLEVLKTDLNSKLYSKEDILKLFERVRDEASDKGLRLIEISPPIEELLYLNSVVPESGEPQFLNIQLTLMGDYVDFGRFVGRLESSNYFRGINDCQVAATQNGSGLNRYQIGFKAVLGRFEG